MPDIRICGECGLPLMPNEQIEKYCYVCRRKMREMKDVKYLTRKVILRDSGGGFVTEIELPTALRYWKLIVWNDRIFLQHSGPDYREVEAYYVPS